MSAPRFGSERMKEEAQRLVDYFSRLSADEGVFWDLGLFMARQWERMLREPRPDVGEARLLFRALESGRGGQGCGWLDLSWWVRWWLAEIDPEGEAYADQIVGMRGQDSRVRP